MIEYNTVYREYDTEYVVKKEEKRRGEKKAKEKWREDMRRVRGREK